MASLHLDSQPGLTFPELLAWARHRFPATFWAPNFPDRLVWLHQIPAAERDEVLFGPDGELAYGGHFESIPIAAAGVAVGERGGASATADTSGDGDAKHGGIASDSASRHRDEMENAGVSAGCSGPQRTIQG